MTLFHQNHLPCPCLALFFAGLLILPTAWAAEPLRLEGLVLPHKKVDLGSPTDAIVQRLDVKEGDWVKENDVLAILYTTREELEARRAETILTKTEFEHQAAVRLLPQKAISEEKALEAKLNHDIAVIDAERANAILAEKTVRAPWDGQVTHVFKHAGETITRTETFIVMLDYRKVYIQVYAPSKFIRKLREGDSGRVQVPLVGEERDALIDFVDPVIDAGSGLFRVKLLVDNVDQSIKPGMTATAQFVFQAAPGNDKVE